MWIESFENLDFTRGIVPTTMRTSDIHWHPRHELFYMIKGTTSYMIGGKRYALQTGEMVFIPKGVMHNMDNKEGIYNERLLLSFDDDIIPEEFVHYIDHLSHNNLIYIPPKHIHEVEKLFKTIENEHKHQRSNYKEMINLCILQLLILINRFNSSPPKSTLAEKDLLINDISKFIQANFYTNISLESLSETFSISKSYLSRKFKNVFGIGVNDYITYIRMLYAEKLLATTDYSITQIAEECGYSDSNYFSTVFRKFKGITARQFKKEHSKY